MEAEFNVREHLENYHGIPLVLRARALSKQGKISADEAAQISLKAAKESGLQELYAAVFKEASSKGLNVGAFDKEWYDTRASVFKARMQKLEDELGTYKASMIKASIQASHMEIAKAYLSAGLVDDALAHVIKAKEALNSSLNTQDHIYTFKLASLLGGKYNDVTNILHQPEDVQNFQKEEKDAYLGSRAVTSLAQLSQMNYAPAIDGLLTLTSQEMKKVEEFSSPRDISMYIAILAIVHLSRREIQSRVLTGETMQILGENPTALFMVEGFVNADYEAFNNNLRNILHQMEIDPYISGNKQIITDIIIEKGIKQYLAVCSSVKISTLASVFRLNETLLETKVLELIKKRSIPFLIDPFEKTLIYKKTQESPMEDIVKKAVKGIEKYIFERQVAKLKFDISTISYKKNADSQLGATLDMY